MNIALPAFIAFLLLLPGFILRTRLKRAERTSLDFSPFGQVVAEAVLWAFSAHLVWLTLSYAVFGQRFDPVVLMQLLSSASPAQAEATVEVGRRFEWVAAYFASLLAASFAVPSLLRSVISRYRLDREAHRLGHVFRFHDAPWYYLLTGADFAPEDEPDLIMVSAIVEVGKEPVLYVGVLDDFFFTSDGKLDRLVLQGVARRPLSADKNRGGDDAQRFYEIDGDSFVLRYSEAKTLNVQYIKLTPENAEPVTALAA